MTATWPSQCPPAPLFREQDDAPASNVVRTDMELGPAKLRRRGTAGVEPVSSTFTMSGPQWLALRDWFTNTLQDGTQPFQWRHPVTGVVTEFRFVSVPRAHSTKPMSSGGRFRVTVSLEKMP